MKSGKIDTLNQNKHNFFNKKRGKYKKIPLLFLCKLKGFYIYMEERKISFPKYFGKEKATSIKPVAIIKTDIMIKTNELIYIYYSIKKSHKIQKLSYDFLYYLP